MIAIIVEREREGGGYSCWYLVVMATTCVICLLTLETTVCPLIRKSWVHFRKGAASLSSVYTLLVLFIFIYYLKSTMTSLFYFYDVFQYRFGLFWKIRPLSPPPPPVCKNLCSLYMKSHQICRESIVNPS